MSFVQFWQIMRAGRWHFLVALVFSVATALFVAVQLPPTYESRARVMLEVVRPDPVTGQTISDQDAEAYLRTQQLLINSDRVAGLVVDKLGWATAPAIIDAWQGATGGFGDVREWAARRIIGATYSEPLEGSGTLEIIYRAPDPDAAETIVRLIRASYIEAALKMQTESAALNAERYDRLADKARAALLAADAKVTQIARDSGTVVEPVGGDFDKRALAAQAQMTEPLRVRAETDFRRSGLPLPGVSLVASLRRAIGDIDTELNLQSGTLGTDNPHVASLRGRRDALRRQLAAAEAQVRAASSRLSVTARDLAARPEAEYRAARAKLLEGSAAALQLAQAQRIAALRRAEYNRLTTAAARFHLLADRSESGLVIMGDAITPSEPVSPNIPVVVALATLFGLAIGFCAAMLNGLIGREVLGREDLEFAAGVPVLGVLPPGAPTAGGWRRWLGRLRPRRPAAAVAAA